MPYRKIVIGVDFTDPSLAAARWVAQQLAPDAEIVLAHALPLPDAPSYLRPQVPSDVESSVALAPVFYGGLRGLAGLIGPGRTQVYLRVGQPADVLARAAAQFGADLVCVGRSARRRGSARFGSTTGVRLLARARMPTLIVPPGTRGTPAHVAAAIDDRAGSEHVVAAACRVAAAVEAWVDAVHVVNDELAPTTAGDERRGEMARADWAHRIQSLAHDWVERMLVAADARPARSAAVVRAGDAGPAVIAHAVERPADLLVVGRGGDASHAAAPPGALLVGSTTRLVTWAAPCPVLVVPLDARPAAPGDVAAVGQQRAQPRAQPRASFPRPARAWPGRTGGDAA